MRLDVVMMGVVLWSDMAEGKAIIWCEDQGDLAFISPDITVLEETSYFDAGDLVQFDVELDRRVRKARNTKLVIEQAGRSLPRVLHRKTQQAKPVERNNVVDLNAWRKTNVQTSEEKLQKAWT